jgi:DNA-binding transcriptional MerR regulator
MMSVAPGRRYGIGEVSDMVGVPTHVLRQWEAKFPQLNPKRDSAGRRRYLEKDIDITRRIKQLLRHEKMTIQGARIRLAQELHGEGRPKTRQETIDLIDKIQEEVRAMLDLLDSA